MPVPYSTDGKSVSLQPPCQCQTVQQQNRQKRHPCDTTIRLSLSGKVSPARRHFPREWEPCDYATVLSFWFLNFINFKEAERARELSTSCFFLKKWQLCCGRKSRLMMPWKVRLCGIWCDGWQCIMLQLPLACWKIWESREVADNWERRKKEWGWGQNLGTW